MAIEKKTACLLARSFPPRDYPASPLKVSRVNPGDFRGQGVITGGYHQGHFESPSLLFPFLVSQGKRGACPERNHAANLNRRRRNGGGVQVKPYRPAKRALGAAGRHPQKTVFLLKINLRSFGNREKTACLLARSFPPEITLPVP